MNKKTIAILCATYFLLVLMCWMIWKFAFKSKGDANSRQRAHQQEQKITENRHEMRPQSPIQDPNAPKFNNLSKEEQFGVVFGASIVFYGKVVDEKGTPVEGAKVEIGAADSFWSKGSEYLRQSNAEGLFSIQGIKGAGIYVNVTKEGYYRVPEKSYGRFGYGMPSGREPHEQPEKPAIFMIQKKGKAEPLFQADSNGAKYFQHGQKFTLDLKNGEQQVSESSIEITSVSERVDGQDRNYTWHFIITVPGGGIVERKDPFQFTAPEDGYRSQAVIGFDGNDNNWNSRTRKENDYFVRFANGTYGRVVLDVWSKTKNGFFFESYVNPSGSKNLEYDPSSPPPVSK